jgi:hypothetical protein
MINNDKLRHMKFIKMFVLIAVILFSFHLHAATAGQDNDTSPTQQCVLACHSCCCLSTAPIRITMLPSAPKVSLVLFSVSDFSYQSPTLDTSKRPPVVSA